MSIDVEDTARVRLIRMNRPEVHNALDPDSMQQLAAALIEFRDHPELDVAIITGEGTKAFCAGADLRRTMPDRTPFAAGHLNSWQSAVDSGTYIRAITLRELGINKPLIAAINGHAIGGGLEIALECHLRIASTAATFGLPEARWASVPGAGGVSNLLRCVPPAVAMKMLLTGERIDAATALTYGLISDVTSSDELLDKAMSLAQQVAANGPLALKAITTMAARAADMPLSQSIATEHLMWGLIRDTHDRIEGRTAFAEKRPPTYTGT
ncbi:enoyl-CoA hydratase/isomerase family protein [Streptomyces sp. NPDC051217]|uniref:enoyl-CoA hydratase/isomerase family protein n=1 Tax=Streptomyces sp. NPDC051217 TaxID=3365644 RepID=UPI00379BBEEE